MRQMEKAPHGDLVVHDGLGAQLPRHRCDIYIRELVKRVGIDRRVTMHTFRHTAAVWLLERNVPVELVAAFLGMSVKTLESTYDHYRDYMSQRAADALDSRDY